MGAGLCLPLPEAAVANAVQQVNTQRSTAHCLLSEGIPATGQRRDLFCLRASNAGLGEEIDTTGPKSWEKHQIRVKYTYLLDSAEKKEIVQKCRVQGRAKKRGNVSCGFV